VLAQTSLLSSQHPMVPLRLLKQQLLQQAPDEIASHVSSEEQLALHCPVATGNEQKSKTIEMKRKPRYLLFNHIMERKVAR